MIYSYTPNRLLRTFLVILLSAAIVSPFQAVYGSVRNISPYVFGTVGTHAGLDFNAPWFGKFSLEDRSILVAIRELFSPVLSSREDRSILVGIGGLFNPVHLGEDCLASVEVAYYNLKFRGHGWAKPWHHLFLLPKLTLPISADFEVFVGPGIGLGKCYEYQKEKENIKPVLTNNYLGVVALHGGCAWHFGNGLYVPIRCMYTWPFLSSSASTQHSETKHRAHGRFALHVGFQLNWF
jgi:hypothetical protein